MWLDGSHLPAQNLRTGAMDINRIIGVFAFVSKIQ